MNTVYTSGSNLGNTAGRAWCVALDEPLRRSSIAIGLQVSALHARRPILDDGDRAAILRARRPRAWAHTQSYPTAETVESPNLHVALDGAKLEI